MQCYHVCIATLLGRNMIQTATRPTVTTQRPLPKKVESAWKRSPLATLHGTSEEVAWAMQIRRVSLSSAKLLDFAWKLAITYRLTTNQSGLAVALTDLLYEIGAKQTSAAWWIDSRLATRKGDYYNMIDPQALTALLPDYTELFNAVTLAHGIKEYGGNQSAKLPRINAKGSTSGLKAQVLNTDGVAVTGWVSVE
jgi:hypothetical protein